ncbi:MAG: carbon monoxide dehydrogenase accessory protein CooC [Dehalococcoidia bacterium]|nr:carbon monoxide dehydrogenase accessory protein CooC [Dehalococcoidia bacterium]
MKLAITGKGGVGKTTLASLLAGVFANEGKEVIAIDANPDANLAMALGIPPDRVAGITPIADMQELIRERTSTGRGDIDAFFKLNPKVDDLVDRFGLRFGNIRLLVMGTVKKGGKGCMCPESALVRNLVSHLVLGRQEVVIMDMDAGIEHLGRGTARAVDAFITVVEPGQRSLQTARLVLKLARDLHVQKCYAVGSKTHNESEREFIIQGLTEFEVIGFINYHPEIAEADLKGIGVYEASPEAVAEAKAIKNRLGQLQLHRKG